MRRGELAACLGAAFSSLMLSYILHASWSVPNLYSDVMSFYSGRNFVQMGVLPYVNEVFEYPPVSGLLLYLSRVVGGDANGYYNVFSGLCFLAMGVLVWATWKVAAKRGTKLSPAFFLMPSFAIYGIYNFDIFHVMFVMLSIAAFMYGRKGTSAGLLGLAISTKLASGVLAPVFLLECKTWRERAMYTLGVVGVVAAVNAPFVVANFSNWLGTYTFIGNYGLEDAWFVWIFQSPGQWDFAKVFGFSVMGLVLLRVYTMRGDFPTKALLSLAGYLLGTYIYSPQFNILLIPLLAVLAFDHPSVYLWDGFNALVILTWFDNPGQPSTLPPSLPQEFALLRTAMLAWFAFIIYRKSQSAPPKGSGPDGLRVLSG